MPRLDVSMADFEDLVAKTLPLPSFKRATQSVSLSRGNFYTEHCKRRMTGARLFCWMAGALPGVIYWWGWFISKTKRVTWYCDQVTDGFPSKKCDSQFKRNLVASDSRFDSGASYPETIQVLDLGAAEPEWEVYAADDLRRRDQEGHQSLLEQYG